MDVSQTIEVLAANKAVEIQPRSPVTNALKEVGIFKVVSDQDLIKGQERLLTAMEEIQKAAGHSSALVRAGDLGGAGARVAGELPPSELRKILATEGTRNAAWSFKQAADGTIQAVEHAKSTVGETLTREQVARAVATKFEHNFGKEILETTLENTARRASQLAGIEEKHGNSAWKPGETLTHEAEEAVELAIKSGHLVVEEAAAKTAAKTAGKILGKAIPLVGIGVVVADVLGAGKDAYASTMDGNYKNAGIDAVRTASKAVFGTGAQLGSVTIVGGVAIAGAGEGVDYWLQSQKSGRDISGSPDNEKMLAAFKNAIHNADTSKDEQHNQFLKEHPDLQKAIAGYGVIKNDLTRNGQLSPGNQQAMFIVEENMSGFIRTGKLSEIKFARAAETLVASSQER
jgi:hypothetical protein